MKKYEFTGETKEIKEDFSKVITVHRIRAIRDFGDVHVGDIGGWIECENNLSHKGNCWVYDNAIVYNCAIIYNNATIHDSALVKNSAYVIDDAKIFGTATAYQSAAICNKAEIHDCACISGNSLICENARIYDGAHISGNSVISGDARIYNNTFINGFSHISMDAKISSKKDIVTIDCIGDNYNPITFYRTKDDRIAVCNNFFTGYLDKFLDEVDKVARRYNGNKWEEVYKSAATFARNQIYFRGC